MLNRVLDEILRDRLVHAQQACVGGYDIVLNSVRMRSAFGDGLHRNASDHGALLMLLLDRSKRNHFLSWSWIEQCLRRSGLPRALLLMVLALLRFGARFVLRGVE